MCFQLGLCIKEGVYSLWLSWLTASLAHGQSPELSGKEHKQGPWWAAVTQNLPAEEQWGGRENARGTISPILQAAQDSCISQGQDGAP